MEVCAGSRCNWRKRNMESDSEQRPDPLDSLLGALGPAGGLPTSEVQQQQPALMAPGPSTDRNDPPAGWYIDSTRSGWIRYWDGEAWTELTTPMPPASPLAAPGAEQAHGPDPHRPPAVPTVVPPAGGNQAAAASTATPPVEAVSQATELAVDGPEEPAIEPDSTAGDRSDVGGDPGERAGVIPVDDGRTCPTCRSPLPAAGQTDGQSNARSFPLERPGGYLRPGRQPEFPVYTRLRVECEGGEAVTVTLLDPNGAAGGDAFNSATQGALRIAATRERGAGGISLDVALLAEAGRAEPSRT